MKLFPLKKKLKRMKSPAIIYDIADECTYRKKEINEFHSLIKNLIEKREINIFNIERYEDKSYFGITIGIDTITTKGTEFKKYAKEYPKLGISKHTLENNPMDAYRDKVNVEFNRGIQYSTVIADIIVGKKCDVYHFVYYPLSCTEGINVTFYFDKKLFVGVSHTKSEINAYLSEYINVWMQSQ